jgi:hypothetical protein
MAKDLGGDLPGMEASYPVHVSYAGIHHRD